MKNTFNEIDFIFKPGRDESVAGDERVGQGRLSVIDVSQDANVPNVDGVALKLAEFFS